MEVAGLIIGIVGLSGLFSACIDCFELVQCVTWGQACGFAGDHYDTRIDEDPQVRDGIELTLAHLVTLLNKGDDLRQKYGLRDGDSTKSRMGLLSSFSNTLVHSRQRPLSRFGNRIQELEAIIKSTQKSSNASRTTRWVIGDKQKFTELVQHIKDFIDDLEGFTRRFDTEQCQRGLIRAEIESISEIPVLEAIEEARMDCRDPVANATSFRLHQVNGGANDCDAISENTFPIRTIKGPDDDEWEMISTNDTFIPTSDHSFQILYRVYCPCGSTMIYLDHPTYSSSGCDASQWVFLDPDNPRLKPHLSHLCGKRKLPDFDAYVTQNHSQEFVVFKDFKCDHEPKSGPIHPSPVAESVYFLSAALCDVLDKVMHHILPQASVPSVHVNAQLPAPYVWYHRSRELIQESLRKVQKAQVDTLPVSKRFDFIDKSMAAEHAIVDEQLAKHIISWRFLKYLYLPGDVVMERNDRRDCNVAADVLQLRIFRLEFNKSIRGSSVGVQFQIVKFYRSFFNSYDDKVPIGMIPIPAIKYITNVSRVELVGRGKKLLDCQRTKYVEYTNFAAPSRRLLGSDRFFIDTALHRKSLGFFDVGEDKNEAPGILPLVSTDDGLNDKGLLLLPTTIWGFDLRMHEWCKLSVQDIEPVRWNPSAFDSLVLPDGKELLCNITESWVNAGFDEEVRAPPRGNTPGLFLLFRGPPGTGKTLAVECIADKTRRPLYRLAGALIGNGAEEAKKVMSTALSYAHAWGCVLLLEDVDLLLNQNLPRRSLMSMLGGFHGILILTTRGTPFPDDDELLSRINFDFIFQSYGHEMCVGVWRQMLKDKLDSDELEELLGAIWLDDSKHHALNGHYINDIVARSMRLTDDKGLRCDYKLLKELIGH
ncbi:prion-inhibition and propagation-domain-containing protein [Xylaria acuta]|nr:prion-inhibition and propagation-domain-containing protein [Xylaria acuta]